MKSHKSMDKEIKDLAERNAELHGKSTSLVARGKLFEKTSKAYKGKGFITFSAFQTMNIHLYSF
jgi:hypothetical protein